MLFQDEEDDETNTEMVEVLIYKHVGEPQIEAVVDPATLELLGPQTDLLVNFLQNVNMPIKTLIEMSIFTKFIEAKINVAKDPEVQRNVAPPSKKVKIEELSAVEVIAILSFIMLKMSE